jgi:SAM-dependent methyltransferase
MQYLYPHGTRVIDTIASPRPYVEAYLRSRPLFFTLIRSQEAALFESVKHELGHPILDLGCGDGFFARLVFGPGTIDVGLDLPGSRIDEAVATGVYHRVETYDGRSIPFGDAHFGTVISNCVLEHVVELPRVLEQVARVTRPGGLFITSVMTDRWEEYQLGAMVLGDRYRGFMRARQEHRNLLSRAGWDTAFHAAGFDVTQSVGYLSARTSRYLDAMHYLSVPAVATRVLSGSWVVAPDAWARLTPLLSRLIDLPVAADESAAIFYLLKRPG